MMGDGGRGREPVRLFIECTATHHYGGRTGIQRVVRSIGERAPEVGRRMGVRCSLVVCRGDGAFWEIAKISSSPLRTSAMDRLLPVRVFFGRAYDALAKAMMFVLPKREGVRRFFIPPVGAHGLKNVLKTAGKLLFAPLAWRLGRRRVAWRKGDVLILLDASWHLDIWKGVAAARARGAKTIVVIYDLIPVTHPQFCVEKHVATFVPWLDRVRDSADSFMTISETVAGDLQRRFEADASRPFNPNWRFDFFHLGGDFHRHQASGAVREELKRVYTDAGGDGTYLAVGTIEPRKNHACLLDAFEKVWADRPGVRLVIAGARGWLSDHVRNRVVAHPLHGQRLFLFHDLHDAELGYAYTHSRALVFPSVVEGFGLPIVEALHHGAAVLASDIPVFREIGENFCAFFDPTSPDALARLVLAFETTGRSPAMKPPSDFHWVDWTESCRVLLAKAREIGQGP